MNLAELKGLVINVFENMDVEFQITPEWAEEEWIIDFKQKYELGLYYYHSDISFDELEVLINDFEREMSISSLTTGGLFTNFGIVTKSCFHEGNNAFFVGVVNWGMNLFTEFDLVSDDDGNHLFTKVDYNECFKVVKSSLNNHEEKIESFICNELSSYINSRTSVKAR